MLSGSGTGSPLKVRVLAFVPVAAGELFEGSFGVVGLGDYVVVGSFFAQDFAAVFSGDDLDVLLIDVSWLRSFSLLSWLVATRAMIVVAESSAGAVRALRAARNRIEIRRSFAIRHEGYLRRLRAGSSVKFGGRRTSDFGLQNQPRISRIFTDQDLLFFCCLIRVNP